MKKFIISLFALTLNFSINAQDTVIIKEEGADINLDRIKEFKELGPREKFHIGGGITGLSFGNPTSLGISPMVGYDIGPELTVGLGFTYQYYSIRIGGISSNSNLFGRRIFVRNYLPFLKELVGPCFLVGQVESFKDINSNSPNSYSSPLLLGLGIGPKKGLNLQVFYDFNYGKNFFKTSPYGSNIVFQVNGFLW